MKRRAVSMVMILLTVIAVGGVLTTAIWGEGCPPNGTCPAGTYPQARECSKNQCDSWAADGYCAVCVPYV